MVIQKKTCCQSIISLGDNLPFFVFNRIAFSFIPFFLSVFSFAQNVGVNTDGSAAETGVMLDIKGSFAKANTQVVGTHFQLKSFDADANAQKLRFGFKTDATAGNRYGFIDFADFASGTPTYRNLSLQPLGGNLGIGTTGPSEKLHIEAGSVFTNGESQGVIVDAGGNKRVGFMKYAGLEGALVHGNTVNLRFGQVNQASVTGGTFTTQMLINTNGNVGIGTTNPIAQLHVASAADPEFIIADHTGTQAAGENIAIITARSNYSANTGSIRFIADDQGGINWSGGDYPTRIAFYTTPDASAVQSERMRISNAGNVGIGSTAPGYKLDVYGSASNYPAKVGSPDGYLLFGPGNTGWSHFITDRARFYFNTGGTFDTGNIGSYDEDLSLQTQGTTRVSILNSDGNVGIGITSPVYKLQVNNATGTTVYGFDSDGSGYPRFRMGGSSAGVAYVINKITPGATGYFGEGGDAGGYQFRGNGPFQILDETSTKFYVDPNGGNVGIGTTGPLQKFHVVGTVRISTLASNSIVSSNTNGDLSYIALTSSSDVLLGSGAFGAVPGKYGLPNTGASAQWVKLGTLTISQQGKSAFIKVVSNTGYNASFTQNYEVNIRFKTSNASSVDANGFAGDASYYFTGRSNQFATNGRIKIVGNIAGAGATAFDFFMYFANYTGDGSFYTIETSAGTWAHSGAAGQADPGAASSTVLWATQEFNIGSDILVANSAGNVGIGTNAPTQKLEVNGKVKSNGINETSDIRFKQNILPISTALDKTLSLSGVNFNWKKEEFPDRNFDDKLQMGLIAQEVEKIIPEVVITDGDGYKSVEYSKIVGLLIEAIKEQQKTIADLKNENQTAFSNMQKEISLLKEDNAQLKAATGITGSGLLLKSK